MAGSLFVFLQLEFPWALGPADGRYLLREAPDSEPQRVVVIETLDADPTQRGRPAPLGPAGWLAGRGTRRSRREQAVPPEPAPASAPTTRVTVIDPVPLSAEGQARAWLEEMDREHEVAGALATVNRVLQAHRVASADPYTREVGVAQALVVRGGWGEGEQVASGRWLQARELDVRPRRGRRRDRSWALRPQERLAALLSGRSRALLCEELTLRARLDFDQGRTAAAAVALERALAAAVTELTVESRQDLALRLAELEQLHEGAAAQAHAALERSEADEELLEHALERLEATLRARTAPGV